MYARLLAAASAFCFLAGALSAEPIPTTTAHGNIEKADKDTLIFQPRDESGKFGKLVTLKLTGTSRITTLSTRTQEKAVVFVQKDAEAKDLEAGQAITVIYATPPKGKDLVLLSAVVQAEASKK